MEKTNTIGEMIKNWVDTNLLPNKVIKRTSLIDELIKAYPEINPGTIKNYILRYSTNAPARKNWTINPLNDNVFYIDGKGMIRRYNKDTDPIPICNGGLPIKDLPDVEENTSGEEANGFALEQDLQNFLSKNLSIIEKGLKIFEKDGITGIEYPVGGRYIDILAVSENSDLVIIELKVSRGYDRTVGQLLRYVNWVKKNIAMPGQKVRGIIVAREISEDLKLACCGLDFIELFEYELSVTLNKISLS